MNSTEPKTRNEIPEKFRWDLSAFYSSEKNWEEDFQKLEKDCQKLDPYRGRLAESAETLKQALTLQDELHRMASKVFTYSHLRADEDTTLSQTQAMQSRAHTLLNKLQSNMSWVEPEILAIEQKKLEELRRSPELKLFDWWLQQLIRQKTHTLSADEERLLSMAEEPLSSSTHAFNMLHDADLKFPKVKNDEGKEVELTQGNYSTFLESRNREVRRQAFEAFFGTFEKYQNTLAAQLAGHIKGQTFYAKARRFSSARAAALFADQIDVSVYDQLIASIRKHLDVHDRYTAIRKRVLGLKDLQPYDLYVPIVPNFELKVTYEQACQWIREAVQPLGQEYCEALDKALQQRWVDALENRGKRSGGYSSGCYDSHPYILMNYNEDLDGLFTLAHEFGHSLHTHFSNKYQPHLYHNYRIFVAEVASTTNETLLFHYLMKKNPDPAFQAYLVNHFCDSFKGTMYRQTMFGEFEKRAYEMAEKGEALTHANLSDMYFELVKTYLGKNVEAHPLLRLEWSRIPHFYNYSFYVYKYATGFAAAQAFAQRILQDKPDGQAVKDYMGFLKTGGSKDPLDTLSDAGVDLRSPEPVNKALQSFNDLVKRLDGLL